MKKLTFCVIAIAMMANTTHATSKHAIEIDVGRYYSQGVDALEKQLTFGYYPFSLYDHYLGGYASYSVIDNDNNNHMSHGKGAGLSYRYDNDKLVVGFNVGLLDSDHSSNNPKYEDEYTTMYDASFFMARRILESFYAGFKYRHRSCGNSDNTLGDIMPNLADTNVPNKSVDSFLVTFGLSF